MLLQLSRPSARDSSIHKIEKGQDCVLPPLCALMCTGKCAAVKQPIKMNNRADPASHNMIRPERAGPFLFFVVLRGSWSAGETSIWFARTGACRDANRPFAQCIPVSGGEIHEL